MAHEEAYKCDRCGDRCHSEDFYKRWILVHVSGAKPLDMTDELHLCGACKFKFEEFIRNPSK
jgi:hypothetical protein